MARENEFLNFVPSNLITLINLQNVDFKNSLLVVERLWTALFCIIFRKLKRIIFKIIRCKRMNDYQKFSVFNPSLIALGFTHTVEESSGSHPRRIPPVVRSTRRFPPWCDLSGSLLQWCDLPEVSSDGATYGKSKEDYLWFLNHKTITCQKNRRTYCIARFKILELHPSYDHML